MIEPDSLGQFLWRFMVMVEERKRNSHWRCFPSSPPCAGGGKPCSCRCEVTTTYGATADFANPLIQVVNSKYNSFLSHFLVFAYPSKKYKTFPNLLDGLLRHVFANLAAVCETGIVSASGERFYVACLGFKLDMEWGVKAAQLTRSYMNVGLQKRASLLCRVWRWHYRCPIRGLQRRRSVAKNSIQYITMVHTSSVVVSPIWSELPSEVFAQRCLPHLPPRGGSELHRELYHLIVLHGMFLGLPFRKLCSLGGTLVEICMLKFWTSYPIPVVRCWQYAIFNHLKFKNMLTAFPLQVFLETAKLCRVVWRGLLANWCCGAW